MYAFTPKAEARFRAS